MNAVTKIKPDVEPVITAPHVLIAINGVTEEIGREGIAKDRRNDAQKYSFRGIDDVYNALAPIIARHKLVIKPRGLSREVTERVGRSYDGKPGATLIYVNVAFEYDFISAVDGSREMFGPFYGEAMDSGDKATNKAQSAAYKYMAIQAFSIPTEGDNDADAKTHEVEPRRPLWIVAAKTAIECLNTEAECGVWWKNNVRGFAGKPKEEVDEVIDYLKARKLAVKPLPARAVDDEARFHRNGTGRVARDDSPPATDPFCPDDEIPF